MDFTSDLLGMVLDIVVLKSISQYNDLSFTSEVTVSWAYVLNNCRNDIDRGRMVSVLVHQWFLSARVLKKFFASIMS